MKGSRFLAKVIDPSENWMMYFIVGVLGLGVLANGTAALILDGLAGWLESVSGWPKVLIQIGLLLAIALLIFLGIYKAKPMLFL